MELTMMNGMHMTSWNIHATILVDPDYNQGRWTGQGENKVYACYIYVEMESIRNKKNKIEMHCEGIIWEVSKDKIVVEELV